MASPTMEKTLTIKYEETPENRFLLCQQCRTHIALFKKSAFQDQEEQSARSWESFDNLDNVRFESTPELPINGNLFEADVYCITCGNQLGHKHFYVNPETPTVCEDVEFFVKLKKLLKWDGTQIVYADTNIPVEDKSLRNNSEKNTSSQFPK